MTSDGSAAAAVQALFLQHAPALRGFILGLLPDREAAHDVFQEVFLAATQGAARYEPTGNFLAWARGIARNKVLEHYRRRRLQPLLFDDSLLEALAESAGTRDELWEERRAALSWCIQQLAPRARQILEMRYSESPTSPTQIAEQLAWTANAVHVALARARKFLQECTQRRIAAEGV